MYDSQAQFDEYREKIANLEKQLLEANANKPNEEEINALKLKVEGILFEILKNLTITKIISFFPQN